jgi:hypothetical protein
MCMSDSYPKFIPIDKEANHQVVHAFRLRKAHRPTYQPLDPRAQVDVLALDLLRVCLAHRVLRCLHMALVGPPAVSKIARNTKGLSQPLQFEEDRILPSAKDIR